MQSKWWSVRFKITTKIEEKRGIARFPKHPSEDMLRLTAKMCAYFHLYELGVELGGEVCQGERPPLVADGGKIWVELGLPSNKKAKRALGQSEQLFCYLYQKQFHQGLSEQKSFWQGERIQFHLIERSALELLALSLSPKSHWEIQRNDSGLIVNQQEICIPNVTPRNLEV